MIGRNPNEGMVQPAPPGLLSLLQLKARGMNPDTLSREVQLQLDSLEWYLYGNNQQTAESSTAIDNTGIFSCGYHGVGAATTVPDNEIWFVHAAAAAIQDFGAAVGVVIDVRYLCTGWTMNESPTGILVQRMGPSLPLISVTVAGALPATQIVAPSIHGFWAPPGSNAVASYGGSWNGGAPSIRNRVRYTPLRL